MTESSRAGLESMTAAPLFLSSVLKRLRETSGARPEELSLIGAMQEQLAGDIDGPAGAEFLAARLLAFDVDGESKTALANVVGAAARALAPDDEPPASGTGHEVWNALVMVADRLHGSGVHPLGRPPFISDRLLEMLVEEAREQLPERAQNEKRVTAHAGRVLATLAVSRKLRDAATEAFGFAVAPTLAAVYMHDPSRSYVRTHLDNSRYELVVHVVLEHVPPGDGSSGSGLVVHLPGRPRPLCLLVPPGEAVALCGRGTIHSWQRLGPGETRTLTGIGFERAA
jgi:hypothetical protein